MTACTLLLPGCKFVIFILGSKVATKFKLTNIYLPTFFSALQVFDKMSFGQSVAEKKFWEMPELVDRLLPFLDVESTLRHVKVHELTQKILQGSHAWKELIGRSCLSNLPTESKEKMDVVKHLVAILKLTKAPKANMLDLL